MNPEEATRLVLDDLYVRRTITDYAAFVDAREWDRLCEVFADDALVDYHNGRTVVSGGDEIVAYVQENTAHLAWQHHNVSVYGVDIDGESATALAYLLSHQVIFADSSHVQMMAARYNFTLRRGEQRWQISKMVHTIQFTNFQPITSQPSSTVDIPPAVAP